MKKILIITIISCCPALIYARGDQGIDKEVFNVCATLVAVVIFMLFFLVIIKRVLENRVKNKIIDKGVSENLAASILQTNPSESTNSNFKWFTILAGLGVALTIIYYTQPLGIHSLAIMAFCLAAAFLGYFIFLRRNSK